VGACGSLTGLAGRDGGRRRATLARQYLLERAPERAVDAIGQLAGMQSQAPLARDCSIVRAITQKQKMILTRYPAALFKFNIL
jgi:hypothetical protein